MPVGKVLGYLGGGSYLEVALEACLWRVNLPLSLCFPSAGTVSSSTGSAAVCSASPQTQNQQCRGPWAETFEPLNQNMAFSHYTLHQVFYYLNEERNWWPSTCLGYRLIAAPRSSRSEKLCHSVPQNLRLFLSVLEGEFPCGDHSVSASHQGRATC